MDIRTFDDLVNFAGDVVAKRRSYEPVNIIVDRITFATRIAGEDWDKRIDPRLARYVLALQDSMDELLAEFKPEVYPEKPPRVRVEVEEGSSIPHVDLTAALKCVVNAMTPEYVFISVIAAIAAVSGGYIWSRWRASVERTSAKIEDTKQLEIHEQTKLEAIRALQHFSENNPEKFQQFEKPSKVLVATMEPDDTVSFTGGDELTKVEAQKSFPKRLRRTEEQTTYADGEYHLQDINYSQGELMLNLSQDGQQIRVMTQQLSSEDAVSLFEDISRRQLTENLPLPVNVQLNVHHTLRRIKYGTIVGVGDPREDKPHKKLSEILTG